MKSRLAFVLALTSLGMLPTTAQSQNPAGSPMLEMRGPHGPRPMILHDFWQNSDVAAKLQLTDTQRGQLEKIFSEHRNKLSSIRDQLKTSEDAVRVALDTDPVNESAYNDNVAKIQSLHAQLGQDFAAMALAFRKVLTLDQWKKLEDLERQQMEGMRMHHEEHSKEKDRNPGR